MALDLIAIYPGGKSKAESESEMRNIHPLSGKKKKLSSSLRTFSLSLKRKRRFLEEVLYEVDTQTLPPIFFL